MTKPTGDTVSSAASDLCEPTNQSRLGFGGGGGGFKETAAITECFRQSCSTGQHERSVFVVVVVGFF